MLKQLKKQSGFTLLELLIVIVIIGILALIIVPGLASGPLRARDAQRKSDITSVQKALETHFNDKNYYPSSANYTALDAVLHGAGTAQDYMKTWPVDPKPAPYTGYSYAPAGTCGAGSCTYVLQATLENTKDSQIKAGTTNTFEVVNKQ